MRSDIFQAIRGPRRNSFLAATIAAGIALIAVMSVFVIRQSTARAATATVDLGAATSFAVLAATTVTNTGPTVVSGDLGVSPGTAVTGFPPGVVINGTIHSADAAAAAAQLSLTAAYIDAATRVPFTPIPADIGGLTLGPGVYRAPVSLGITGTVTLDGGGDPNAVFIFQIPSTLITAPNAVVNLINGAQACNVFWQVGSSATLDTGTTFAGNILALTSITANTGATVDGRLLARGGAVTLDTNAITRPDACLVGPTANPNENANSEEDANPPGPRAFNHSDDHMGLSVNNHSHGRHLSRSSDQHRGLHHR
jgi:hypothetical protein